MESRLHTDSHLAEEMHLENLGSGSIPGMTANWGGSLAEAAAVCLEHHEHSNGVRMNVDGDYGRAFALYWRKATGQARRTWGDMQEATEHGAYGVAALLIEKLTGLTVLERSFRRTGFDYWIGEEGVPGPLFQKKARLEVSGILQGSEADIKKRCRMKVKQINRYRDKPKGFVVVVEFGSPRSRVLKEWKT